MEAVTDFIFLSSRMTMDSDCSHEIKILAWRKDSYDKVRVLENSRHHFAVTKVCIVKTMVFLVVMYGCESWTIKKAKHQELMLLNHGAGEDSWESFGLQGGQTSQS